MKGKIYHLCYTSHGEVLCRKYLDYCMLFNCIAQATIGTDAQLLAYGCDKLCFEKPRAS